MSASLIPGFAHRMIDIDGGRMSVHVGGKGAPLLLLHGFPQTHLAWLRTAPGFAERFTCIIPDLPGYGASEMPPIDPLCSAPAMSKRVMALRLARMMAALGHARFDVLGHDRGARVAYRMALDMPARVSRIGVVEVIPTADMWRAFDAALALRSWHWSFLAQPSPLPETMIAAAPDAFLDGALKAWTNSGDLSCFPSSALHSYRAQMRDPACLRAMCEDYRAGAGIDRVHDEEDRAAGRTIKAPLHFVWTASGFPSRSADPVGLWRPWADTVTGAPSASGHFALEEHPDAVLDAFLPFFSAR